MGRAAPLGLSGTPLPVAGKGYLVRLEAVSTEPDMRDFLW